MQVWRSEDKSVKLALSFDRHMGSGDQAQTVRLTEKASGKASSLALLHILFAVGFIFVLRQKSCYVTQAVLELTL